RLDETQRLLRGIPGVTLVLYDQRGAAEKRRRRKRGKLPDPAMRVFINEAVCEGCGDCGVKSNCLSVQPVETEFGRKTQIHQSSCNKDYSCLRGDCPSFVTVVPLGTPKKRERKTFAIDQPLPEPALKVNRAASIFMTGIGGTGVVTVNQILGTAALLDGKQVRGLDQTGLSQKGGPVVSHLKISDRPIDVANKVSAGEAGAIPVSAAAIEEAIGLNGVSVQMNTQAFRAGRMLVVDPRWAAGLRKHRIGAVESTVALTAEARAIVEKSGATGELCRLIEIRVPELIAYQDAGYAREYVDFVKRVAAAEQASVPGDTRLAEAVARYLFKLMAYTDEYEV